MPKTTNQKRAGKLLEIARNELENLDGMFGRPTDPDDIDAVILVLERARELAGAKDEARERKNAGDRARRAKKKKAKKKGKRATSPASSGRTPNERVFGAV